MHKKTHVSKMKIAFIIALLVVCHCTWAQEALLTEPGTSEGAIIAYIEGIPGGLFHDQVNVQAKVTAINQDTREVTMVTDNGVAFSLVVGSEAINFENLQVGDHVKATATQTLAAFVGDANDEAEDGVAAVAVGTPKGEKPGLFGVESAQLTATVTAVDLVNRIATLQFSDGSIMKRNVREDVKLDEQQVGAKVVMQMDAIVSLEVIPGDQ